MTKTPKISEAQKRKLGKLFTQQYNILEKNIQTLNLLQARVKKSRQQLDILDSFAIKTRNATRKEQKKVFAKQALLKSLKPK